MESPQPERLGLSCVLAGESVEIERHGHTVAVVVPPQRGYLSGSGLFDLLGRLPLPARTPLLTSPGLGRVLRVPADPWQS